MDEPAHMCVGTHSADETEKLAIKVGDWATVPKRHRALMGTRANARSFDDRVGCAALIEAVKELGPDFWRPASHVHLVHRRRSGPEGRGRRGGTDGKRRQRA
jgi:putative aminopeptidase FrvX